MTISLKHSFVSAKPDGSDASLVQPSNWNAEHTSFYTAAGSGAVTRTLDSKISETVSVKDFGAVGDGVTDDTAALNAWLDAISAQSADGYCPAGVYLHSAPLTFNPRTSADRPPARIVFSPRAVIRTTSSMTAQLTLGTTNSDYSGLLRGGVLQGGVFDCNDLAQTGVHAVFLNWFLIRDTQVWNFRGAAFKSGSASSPAGSYEAFYDNVRTWSPPRAYKTITGITKANPAVVTSANHGFVNGQLVSIQGVNGMTQVNFRYFAVANVTANTFELQGENSTGYGTYTSGGQAHATRPTTTRGVFFENCGDSHIANSLLQSCFRGVDGDVGGGLKSFDGKFVNTHVWNFFENGELDAGFYLGGDNCLANCQVDGPFLYAYRFSNLRNALTNCNVNQGSAYGAIDGRSVPVYLDSGAGVFVCNCNWKAADPSFRLFSDAAGDLSNYRSLGIKALNVISTRNGLVDVGANTWALCSGGVSPSILRGNSMAAVTRISAGKYELTATFPLPVNGPIIPVAIDSTQSLLALEDNGSRTTNKFTVLFRNSATGTLTDPANFSVSIVGA